MILLLLIAAPVVLCAQQQADKPNAPVLEVTRCTQELVEKAHDSFRRRMWHSETLFKAERQLATVVQLCAEAPGAYPAKQNLRIVREELAEHQLLIALFYLDRRDGRLRKLGALSRLEQIVKRYPEYSKLDQALSLLGKLNLEEGKLDEAAAYYQRIIKEFPGSPYVGETRVQLGVIEATRDDAQQPR